MTSPASASMTAILSRITLAVINGPTGAVDPAQSKDSKPWPHVAYTLALSLDGREFWRGPYKFGVGNFGHTAGALRDPKDQAKQAASIAAVNPDKYGPTVARVLPSLLLDGSAHFDHQSFEDWAGDFGYDPDSRKAEATWKACDETGRKLARAFSASEIEQLREWTNEQ